jgi:CRISPR-associated protein (TIGR02584 family)
MSTDSARVDWDKGTRIAMHAAVDEGTEQDAVRRQILLVVTGLTPQVVTETIYALWRTDPALVPTDVHLVTTQRGADNARLNLLSPSLNWIGRLRRDYQLPPIDFNAGHIHVIPGPDGAALEDIRTPEDNVRAADFITDLVRQLTACEQDALHVSIAGGRKSMGYFVGYALSLFGRPQDRLSHVLVSPPFENHRDFYYPTPTECPIHVPQGGKDVAYDCRNAKVDLAWIPFVRLRSAQHEPLLTGSAQFSACVSSVQEALAERELVIDLRGKRIRAGGQLIRVPQTELAFLSWFARRAQAGAPPLSGITAKDQENRAEPYRDAYVAELRRIDPLLDEEGKTLRATGLRYGMTPEYFNAKNAKLNTTLSKRLGALAARPYLVLQEHERAGYSLALPAHAIHYAALPADASQACERSTASPVAGC